MEAASDALSIEQVASRWIVASDAETALAQITPYLDLGFNHLVFHGPGHDQSRFLTSFAADVVPGLRTLMSERFGA
jgi:coenzyme F420-dependent glucose-6-phosphate dehydrogenase